MNEALDSQSRAGAIEQYLTSSHGAPLALGRNVDHLKSGKVICYRH